MRSVRYLTFEVGDTCGLADLHKKCPVSDPERFMFGKTEKNLDDITILRFWRWCRAQGFNGIILWHLYNEPMQQKDRIKFLLRIMREEVPEQKSHLWSGLAASVKESEFDHVQHTNYAVVRPDDLDNRRASTRGEGLPYAAASPRGSCGRGYGWEVIIDSHGNWLLCCNDWRCEETSGNIFEEDWNEIHTRYKAKADISWRNEVTYNALPRMCRSCIAVNPNLHRSALPPAGVSW